MWHPLQSSPYVDRRILLYVTGALGLAAIIAINVVEVPLITEAAPMGAISLQLAGEPFIARQILNSWQVQGLQRAEFGLGLDFLLIPCYAALLSVLCLWAAKTLGRPLPLARRVGEILAWGTLAAALADCAENFCLFRVLLGEIDGWAPAARALSLAKWSLIFPCLLYGLLGAYQFALGRLSPVRTVNRAVMRD
jgi:hypothetical protein